MPAANNKRIVTNTIALYVRMAISMFVSLYTSRVILEYLGVLDFGIYSVVGGITAFFGFINSSMSNASSRFLSVAIGKQSSREINLIFNSSIIIHLIIAGIFVLFAETIGLWYVANKLVLPDGYHSAAMIVYQFTIAGAILSIMQTPFSAMIISYERMSIYAYLEILNVCLKLGIVYMLGMYSTNRLEIYAGLLFLATVLICTINFLYCRLNFPDSRLCKLSSREYIRPMLSFSTWSLLGDVGYTVRQNGSNIVMNLFFGPIVNAANGIAMTVQGVIMALANNLTTALRPPIIKEIACGNRNYASKMIESCSILSLLLMGLLIGPLVLNMDDILKWWLVNVPDYTLHFTNICLLSGCVSNVSNVIYIGLQADAIIRRINLVRFVVYMLTLPSLYILLKLNFRPEISYWIIFISLMITTGYSVIILKRNFIDFNTKEFCFRITMLTLITVTIGFFIHEFISFNNKLNSFIVSSSIYIVLYLIISYIIVLNDRERNLIKQLSNLALIKFKNG